MDSAQQQLLDRIASMNVDPSVRTALSNAVRQADDPTALAAAAERIERYGVDPERDRLLAVATTAAAEATDEEERSVWERLRDALSGVPMIPGSGLDIIRRQIDIATGGNPVDDLGIGPPDDEVEEVVGGYIEDRLDDLVQYGFTIMLTITFVVAAGALIVLGIMRMLGTDLEGAASAVATRKLPTS